MRIHGWCERCRRIRLVTVAGRRVGMLAASGMASGICDECEREQQAENAKRRGR